MDNHNKKFAEEQSEQTKGVEKKFEMTDDAWRFVHYRADKMRDYFRQLPPLGPNERAALQVMVNRFLKWRSSRPV